MSWPRSFAISGRSNDHAGCGPDGKFKPMVLGEIQAADDSRKAVTAKQSCNQMP
jgi:hypothetical protein